MPYSHQGLVVGVDAPWLWPKLPGAEDYVLMRDHAHRTFGFTNPYAVRVIILVCLAVDPEEKATLLNEAIRGFRDGGYHGVFFVAAYGSPAPRPEAFACGEVAHIFQDPDKYEIVQAATTELAVPRHRH